MTKSAAFGSEIVDEHLNISWSVENDSIFLSLNQPEDVESVGYLSIGLNEDTSMKLSEILVATKSEDGLVLYEYRGLEYNSHPESLLEKTFFWKLHNFTLIEDRITHMTVSRPRYCPDCKVISSFHI